MTNAVPQPATKGPSASASRLASGTVLSGGAIRVGESLAEDPIGLSYRGERLTPAPGLFAGPVLLHALDPALQIASDEALQRLRAAIQVAAGLSHKALLSVHEVLVAGAQPVLVSELPQGQSLRYLLQKKRRASAEPQPMSLRGAYNIIASACNLLTYAHGVLPHGALCPEFIDVSSTGQIRVAALGIGGLVPPARVQAICPDGASYLAPERLAGGPPSAAADIYAIGAILFECLTLRPAPLGAEAERARPSALFREVPKSIDGVVARCLRLDAAARWPTPQALKEALAAAVENVGRTTTQNRFFATPAADGPRRDDPKVSVQMPAVASDGAALYTAQAPAAPPRPGVTPLLLVAAQADAAGEAAEHMAHTPPKGSPKIPGLPSGPQRPAGFPVPPPTLGAPSNPSGPRAAVGLDEDADRFLIQKEDKMTYGPFPLREVRSQIEKGTISADHVIEDQETGDRRRVREHPLLGDMAREWEGRHAQSAMELRAEADKAKHRASVQKLLSAIFIVVLLIGAGVGAYFQFFYKPPVKTVVVKEQSDDFFKGVEIAMKVDPPEKRLKKKGTGKKVLKNGKWVEEVNLGDAASDGGDETLSADQVQGVMNKSFKLLGGCLREEATRNPGVKKMDLEFQILGNGSVSAVKVNGETGSTAASCVFAKMQAVQFPKFNGTKTHAAFSLALK